MQNVCVHSVQTFETRKFRLDKIWEPKFCCALFSDAAVVVVVVIFIVCCSNYCAIEQRKSSLLSLLTTTPNQLSAWKELHKHMHLYPFIACKYVHFGSAIAIFSTWNRASNERKHTRSHTFLPLYGPGERMNWKWFARCSRSIVHYSDMCIPNVL